MSSAAAASASPASTAAATAVAVASSAVQPVFSIGHSNTPADSPEPTSLVARLKKHNITRLVDVRSSPASRANPQFNSANVAAVLAASGIEYIHCGILGGREKGGDVTFRLRADPAVGLALCRAISRMDLAPLAAAAVTAASSSSSSASAAAAAAPASKAATTAAACAAAAENSNNNSSNKPVRAAFMCSEANWTECHRQNVVAFAVAALGQRAFHILPNGDLEEHTAKTRVVLTQRDAETAAIVEKMQQAATAAAASSSPSVAPTSPASPAVAAAVSNAIPQMAPEKRAPRRNKARLQ